MILFLNRARAAELLAFLFICILFIGCASYQHKVDLARKNLEGRNAQVAMQQLEPLAKEPGNDQLVYLLDYATAAQEAGDYQASNKAFMDADQMSEVKDYHSISKISASLLTSERMMQYKGDDYEKVLINAMLAVNFLMVDNLDSALVETRRINEKLEHYRVDAKRPYEQNPFAFYLSALIWEADRKWDDAYIDFNKAYKLDPNIPYLKEDLIRASKNARRESDFKKWKAKFGQAVPKDPSFLQTGELILIYQQGWGPRKQPSPNWHRIPKLYPTRSYIQQAKLVVEGVTSELTQPIYSVERVAIKTLDDQYAPLIAKRIAGMVVKDQVAQRAKKENELLGTLLEIGMHVSDQADLRQWSTLPETFQIAKVTLKPGTYKVTVHGLNSSGQTAGEGTESQEIVIKPRKKSFIRWRSFN